MSFTSWLTDRIILQPTRHRLHVPQRKSLLFAYSDDQLEVWVHRVGQNIQQAPDLYLLEFPGTASRAEDTTDFIEHCWSRQCVEIWAVNPPGYGNSSGTASLKKLPAMAKYALKQIRQVAGDTPVIAVGGSLGSVSALYLAAHNMVDGVMVQNPPALREVILAQSDWWHLKWLTCRIAAQIPPGMDSLANARRAIVPAIVVTAQQDEVVPARIQCQIIDAYSGPLKVLAMQGADHDTPLTETDLERLRPMANWLYDRVTPVTGLI